MASKRFARLSNGFSKKIDCHLAAVSLHVAFYNLCRKHETLLTSPALALGIADHIWTIGELIDAALAVVGPSDGRRKGRPQLRVIDGGKD